MDKQALLAEDLPEDVITLPRGGTVTVRALSRREVADISAKEPTLVDSEAWMIHFGLVEPRLSFDEVKTWQANSRTGETDYVSSRIGELSGLNQRANKEYYKSLGGQPNAGVGAPHSGEAGDDDIPTQE
jgi:hypothetical protein